MKLNKKLIAPVLALASLLAVGVGTTYALFTDSDSKTVSVTAGKVDVSVSIELTNTYSGVDLEGTSGESYVANSTKGTFTNGGTASVEGNSLTISNMTPGDKVEFKVTYTNASTVAIKYKASFTSGSESASIGNVLEVTCDGAAATTSSGSWTNLSEQTSWSNNYAIAMPSTVGNDYQEASITYTFAIEAVQGNAKTTD